MDGVPDLNRSWVGVAGALGICINLFCAVYTRFAMRRKRVRTGANFAVQTAAQLAAFSSGVAGAFSALSIFLKPTPWPPYGICPRSAGLSDAVVTDYLPSLPLDQGQSVLFVN